MAEKPIKALQGYGTFQGPGATAPNIQSRGVGQISVPTARPARIPDSRTTDYGLDSIQKGVRGLKEGLGVYARALALSEDRAIRSSVVDHTMKMKKRMKIKEDLVRKNEGSDSIGKTNEFLDMYEEYKDEIIGDRESWNPKAYSMLEDRFSQIFASTSSQLKAWEASESGKSVVNTIKNLKDQGIQDIYKVTLDKTGAWLDDADRITKGIVSEMLTVDDSMPPEEVARQTREIKESIVTAGFVRLLNHDPLGATTLWENKKKYFEDNMTTNWNAINTKIKDARPAALKDKTLGVIRNKHPKEPLKQYNELKNNYDTYLTMMEGDVSGIMDMEDTLMRTHARVEAEKVRVKKAVAEETYLKIYNNPDNYTKDAQGKLLKFIPSRAVAELEVAGRQGDIPVKDVITTKNIWESTGWTVSDANAFKIQLENTASGPDGYVMSNADIIKALPPDADSDDIIAYATRMRSDHAAGLGHINYITQADARYDGYLQSLSPERRKKAIQGKQDYLDDVRNYMIRNKLTKADPLVKAESLKLFEDVVKLRDGTIVLKGSPEDNEWYGTEEGKRHAIETFHEGRDIPHGVEEINLDDLTPDERTMITREGFQHTQASLDAVRAYLLEYPLTKDKK